MSIQISEVTHWGNKKIPTNCMIVPGNISQPRTKRVMYMLRKTKDQEDPKESPRPSERERFKAEQ